MSDYVLEETDRRDAWTVHRLAHAFKSNLWRAIEDARYRFKGYNLAILITPYHHDVLRRTYGSVFSTGQEETLLGLPCYVVPFMEDSPKVVVLP